ncbi:TetR/AcrR family transcriptional regulator [Pediococcus argentinicus]|uniref:HTH tetR-type domain-containing protein n=1 Tax=Pediococcus argentinicus TaxID=480391 RepID=A0A0R2NGG4_9LACO|nr:TetR/AcrR family transcriptional regulator [Pediococcus argentinicus]KRO24911.1 hypothetical protein IV88_GL000575 [Pediococcus argentinicus]NKZ22610.1 hypothetical protein [Pediococcus argentinicus]GEP19731.1 TetR family transcriptional regulator [Pediococcus argentinicus]
MADRQAERMTRTIQQSFLNLLKKYTFKSITTSKIADEALIHRTTFYAYYEDKYALLDTLLSDQFQRKNINNDDLNTHPFTTLAQLCTDELSEVVKCQQDDASFQHAMLKMLLGEISNTYSSSDSLVNYISISRIKAVVHWVRETKQPYNIYSAGSVLDNFMSQAIKDLD